MPKYSVEIRGVPMHFEWNEKRKPTEQELDKIAQKLLIEHERELPQNDPRSNRPSQFWKPYISKVLQDIEESPVGKGTKWLMHQPGLESLTELSDKAPYQYVTERDPAMGEYPPEEDTSAEDKAAQESAREINKKATEFTTPSRLDYLTAGGATLAKNIKPVGRGLQEFGKFLAEGGELGSEAGVLKIGAREAGKNPRLLGTNPRAIKEAENRLDEIVDLITAGEDEAGIAQKLNLKPGTVGSVIKKHGLKKGGETDIENAVKRIAEGEDEIKLVDPEVPSETLSSLDDDVLSTSSSSGGANPPNIPNTPGGGGPPEHKYGGGREPFRLKDLKDLAGPFQRSLQSMGEMSFPLRQGRVALASHPSQAPAVFKGMFKGFMDPSYADEVVDEIYKRPFATIPEFAEQGDELIPTTRNLYKEAKLGISDPSDVFPSNLAHQIPGIAQLSKRSEAAYGIGADTLRANLFDQVLAKHGFDPSNLPSDEQVKQFGNYVNTVTGYGRGGGAFEGAVKGDLLGQKGKGKRGTGLLQYLLYSPRYQKSQLDILNPVNYTGMTERFGNMNPFGAASGAKEMAKDVGKFGAVTGAGLAGADYALGDKADVDWNPFSTDFAKLKIGDTRIDPLGPLGAYPRYGLKMANEFGKNIIGDKYEEAAEPIIGEENLNQRNDPLWNTSNLIRGKLAPGLPSFAMDMLVGKGKNVVGDSLEDMPFSFPGVGSNKHFETPYLGYELGQTSPLFYQDLAEIEDPATQAGVAVPGFFGANINTYKPKERKRSPSGVNPYSDVEKLYKKLYGQ